MNILLVGIGGALGSVSRYLLGTWIQSISRSLDFPFGTLAVNWIGCFVIGFLAELAETRGAFTPESRAFLFIGVLGGFTTFSSFGNDTINLFRDGNSFSAIANIGSSVVVGLTLVWLGRVVAHLIWR